MTSSFADRIRQAKSQPEAMLAIAEGLDAVLAALGSTKASDEWGSWGGGAEASGDTENFAAPQPTDYYAAKPAEPDYAGMARANAMIARLESQPFSPQTQALLEQAYRALDAASQPGEYLDHSGDIIGPDEALPVTEDMNGNAVIELPAASPERKAKRRELAEAIDLPGFFPPIMRDNPTLREDIIHSYELGGPRWLYNNRIINDHDIFEQLPMAAKRVMVVDFQQDSPREAWEFQRDVLKGAENGADTLEITQSNINSMSGTAAVPLRGGGGD